MGALATMGDQSLAVDVLGALNSTPGYYTLETAAVATGLCEGMLLSEHDRYKAVAMATVGILTKSFAQLINSTREASPSAYGVDLSMEERLERCNSTYQGIMACKGRIQSLLGGDPEVSKKAHHTIGLIEQAFGR
mmetsp:Transcript_70116/g.222283  ORF Transcript_70116/g.222283 Transcript_70116/m.222283 type:complete len:135 (+) Transcript_70116:85-489(+)